jgi:hypothetical protein
MRYRILKIFLMSLIGIILIKPSLYAQGVSPLKKRIFIVSVPSDNFSNKPAALYHYYVKKVL